MDATGDLPPDVAQDTSHESRDPVLVDWPRAGRRLARSAVVLSILGVTGWIATSIVTGHWRVSTVGNWMGLVIAGMLLVELWVVGGSALRGMLRAGERGERLSSRDVGLLPPQARKPRRKR